MFQKAHPLLFRRDKQALVPPNFCVAAQRTYRDAALLEQAQRLANADHLYGLAAECALKAVLVGLGVIPSAGPPPRDRWRKHIDQLWAEYVAYVSGTLHRGYLVASVNPFQDWEAGHRYEEDALFTPSRLTAHAAGALSAGLILEQAILDGVVT
jgi:hypothetical protein